MKKLLGIILSLLVIGASAQTNYYAKTLRFSSIGVDSSYTAAKLFMNYSSGKLRIHWGDSTSTIWPLPGNTVFVTDSTGLGGTLTPPRIPFARTPTTLSDSYALKWDTVNLAINLKSTRMFAIDKTTADIFWGPSAGNFTTTGLGENVGLGYRTLQSLTTGYQNFGGGSDALRRLTTGYNNVSIGGTSNGEFITTGNNNFFVMDDTSANTSYRMFIGGLLKGWLNSSTDKHLDIRGINGAVNNIHRSLNISRGAISSPSNGIGVGIGFNVQTHTAATTEKVISAIDVVTTDITPGTEDGDMIFKTMSAGATAAERVRFTSTGAIAVNGASNYGASGQFLKSNGNAPPTWASVSGGSGGAADTITVGTTKVISGTNGYILYNNSGILGNATTGTGVLTALGVNVGSAGAFVVNNAFTAGSILFSGSSMLDQDNTNLFWDDTNNYLGIGDNTPSAPLEIGGQFSIEVGSATTSGNAKIQFLPAQTSALRFTDGTNNFITFNSATPIVTVGQDINITENIALNGSNGTSGDLLTSQGTSDPIWLSPTEATQDAVGAMVDASLNYVDGTPLLQRAALTGDITASAGSNATTIANDAVTFAKFQNITDARLLGRSAGSTGDMQHITAGNGLTLSSGDLSVNTSIPGTITNDAASAGNLAEFLSSFVAVGSAVSLTTATTANVASISLTAGDWDVEGAVIFNETTATVTGRTAAVGSVSETLPTNGTEIESSVATTVLTVKNTLTIPRKRFSLSASGTAYLIAKATFSAGTVTAYGQITVRRVR